MRGCDGWQTCCRGNTQYICPATFASDLGLAATRCKALAWLGLVQNGIGDEGALSLVVSFTSSHALTIQFSTDADFAATRRGQLEGAVR